MLTYLWIALGGALGSVARYAASTLTAQTIGGTFPWGTLVVNVTGSFLIGVFASLGGPAGRVPLHPDARLFLTVGICGGYTTFSSFSLQTLDLLREGHPAGALGNIAGSVLLCLVASWAGVLAGQAFNGLRPG